MALNAWADPATGSGRDASRAAFNARSENLLTNHSGTADPAYMRECMWQVRTDAGEIKLRNATNTAWFVVGKFENNFGMLRIDGSNAMTGDLDFDGNRLVDPENDATAAGGSRTGRAMVTIGGATRYIHLYDG